MIRSAIARRRFVQAGTRRGNLIAIVSGPKPGELILTSRQIKLRNGSPTRIDNAFALSANPAHG